MANLTENAESEDSKRDSLVAKIGSEKERYQRIIDDLRFKNSSLLEEGRAALLYSECAEEIDLVEEPLDLIDTTIKYLESFGNIITGLKKEHENYEVIKESKGPYDLKLGSNIDELVEIRKRFANFPDEILREQISLLNRKTNVVFDDFREILNSIYLSQYGKEDVEPQFSSEYVKEYSEAYDLFKRFKSSEADKNIGKLTDLIADFGLNFSWDRDNIRKYISDRETLELFGIMREQKRDAFQQYYRETEDAVDKVGRGNLFELLIKVDGNVYNRVFSNEEKPGTKEKGYISSVEDKLSEIEPNPQELKFDIEEDVDTSGITRKDEETLIPAEMESEEAPYQAEEPILSQQENDDLQDLLNNEAPDDDPLGLEDFSEGGINSAVEEFNRTIAESSNPEDNEEPLEPENNSVYETRPEESIELIDETPRRRLFGGMYRRIANVSNNAYKGIVNTVKKHTKEGKRYAEFVRKVNFYSGEVGELEDLKSSLKHSSVEDRKEIRQELKQLVPYTKQKIKDHLDLYSAYETDVFYRKHEINLQKLNSMKNLK